MKDYGADKRWPFAQGGGATIAVFTILWGTAVTLNLCYTCFKLTVGKTIYERKNDH